MVIASRACATDSPSSLWSCRLHLGPPSFQLPNRFHVCGFFSDVAVLSCRSGQQLLTTDIPENHRTRVPRATCPAKKTGPRHAWFHPHGLDNKTLIVYALQRVRAWPSLGLAVLWYVHSACKLYHVARSHRPWIRPATTPATIELTASPPP